MSIYLFIVYLSIYCYVYLEYLSRRRMGSHFLIYASQQYRTLYAFTHVWTAGLYVLSVRLSLFKNIYENNKSTG
jgi:hypothetical protein